VMERPRITPHKAAMAANLAAALGIEASAVNVKASTGERIGFVGREEGVAALATVTVIAAGGGEPGGASSGSPHRSM